MVWFLPTVARGDQLLSSSSIVVFALNGEASVESSTFIYPRTEAVFVLVRVLGHLSGLYIHPTMNVRATFHVALGWRRVRRAGRFRLLGGFIHSSTCAAITRTHLCPFGLLSSAVPFMALSHISPKKKRGGRTPADLGIYVRPAQSRMDRFLVSKEFNLSNHSVAISVRAY